MRQENQFLLDEVKGQMDQYGDFTIFQYAKVTANAMGGFRNNIVKLGGEVQVVSKRILCRAAIASGLQLDAKSLPGHIGIAFAGSDSIETTKAVFQFSKDSDSALTVVGGRFDGKLYNAQDTEVLSALPGKDGMRAELLGLFEAPMSQTLAVINAILTAIPCCLENKSNKES